MTPRTGNGQPPNLLPLSPPLKSGAYSPSPHHDTSGSREPAVVGRMGARDVRKPRRSAEGSGQSSGPHSAFQKAHRWRRDDVSPQPTPSEARLAADHAVLFDKPRRFGPAAHRHAAHIQLTALENPAFSLQLSDEINGFLFQRAQASCRLRRGVKKIRVS